MATTARRPEVVAIVGPTASGKSALALKIAQKLAGEIISADSRTIYKGMDIGTAKPSSNDQQSVPYYGLDLVNPGEPYSAYEFKKYAIAKIQEIKKRGRLPILVGGSGLYVDGVLFDFDFRTPPDPKKRTELEKLSLEELQKVIHEQNLPMPENSKNKRYLIRAIEAAGQVHKRKTQLDPGVILIGLMPPDDVLKANIAKRAEGLISKGIIEETRRLLQEYGSDSISNTAGIAYKAIEALIRGKITNEQAVELIKQSEWQYARRQKTYFKRNPGILWFENTDKAHTFLTKTL